MTHAKAWAGWLGRFEWTHALTLIFSQPASPAAARRAMQRFSRDLGRRDGKRVPWFFATEVTHTGYVHIHALVDTDLDGATVRSAWKPGQAKVETFDPDRGWRYYITKEIGESSLDWDIDRLARQRLDGLSDSQGAP